MGLAGGFGQAVLAGTLEGITHGRLQPHSMPYRHIDRLDGRACPQHHADNLTLIPQGLARPFLCAYRLMTADQPRLGYSNGRQAGENTQVAGQPQAARMGQPLPITQQPTSTPATSRTGPRSSSAITSWRSRS